MDILSEVKSVFEIEKKQLNYVENSLDDSVVEVICAINQCEGKVVLCGMGKPGHIARKISATMSSMGIPSYVLHPSEAQHGDLGTLTSSDIIVFISNSGETEEICRILPNIRIIGLPIVAITSNGESTLAKYADYCIVLPRIQEASALGLAPTSSTTAALVIGDAIAVVVSKMREFKKESFALYHPAGALGKKLITRVDDIMASEENNPVVLTGKYVSDAIAVLCETGLGAVMIIDMNHHLLGLITDGDLKRYLKSDINPYKAKVDDVMTINPICAKSGMLAVDALRVMENRDKQLSVIPVIDDKGIAIGLVRTHDILKRGIFI